MDKARRRYRLTRWTRLFILLGAILGLVAIQSCSSNWLTKKEMSQTSYLTTSELNDPATFNPVVGSDAHAVLGLIYEGLITQNGETGELEPGIADSWEFSSDQRHLRFHLRPNARWSDGVSLTADDVIFSFRNIYFNESIPNNMQDILRIGEERRFPQVRKVSKSQVEFVTQEPFAPLLRYVGGIRLLPKHVLEDTVNTFDEEGRLKFISVWGTNTPPEEIVTNGSYRLLRFYPGERVILERNPYYWRKDIAGKSQPYIDRIVIPIVGSTDNSLMQFRSGGLDMVSLTPNFFALMKQEEKRGNFTIYNGGPSPATHFIAFNLNQGTRNGKPVVDPIKSRWFNTLEFRQAIAYAIDRETMVNNIFQGLATLQNSSIHQRSPYYISSELKLPVYNYDPGRARHLLKQGGFHYNSQGQLEDSDGNQVRFSLITSSDNRIREQIAVHIKQDLAAIGIDVDFQILSFSALMTKLLRNLDWDAYILHFVGGGMEPDSVRNVWSVNGTLHTFNQNAFYGSPLEGRTIQAWERKIDSLYVQASQEIDEDKRRELYDQTQILAQEYLPFIYLVNPLSFSAIRNNVKNVRFSGVSWRLWNAYELKKTESFREIPG
jgi:peptide/nickel transport system substrate-binding protein